MSQKTQTLILLVLAQVAALSLWFATSAILADLSAQGLINPNSSALLSSAVQAGFVVGALFIAALGIADRFDPRRVFGFSAAVAAVANASLLVVPVDSIWGIGARLATGAALAGVYPVGMKMAAAWGTLDRGFLVSLLVGALTLGSASPYLISFFGGSAWQTVVLITSAAAFLAAGLVLMTALGPHLVKAARFSPKVVLTAWTNRRVRYAYLGYLGHMVELYAMWAWLGAALTVSLTLTLGANQAAAAAKLITFLAIAAGAISCVIGGRVADKIGKARFTIYAMLVSGLSAIAFGIALASSAPVILLGLLAIIWGASIIPDSPQFSALVADHAPADQVGSLLTLQTALGFTLTIITVQSAPMLAAMIGWPLVMGGLAVGPFFGVIAMRAFLRVQEGV